MLLSTAIPIVIAAIVIVIISKGIPNNPIIPKIKKAAIKFGTTPIRDKVIFLNNIKNIKVIPGAYEVAISKKQLAKFTNHNYNLRYFIALEPDSTYA